MDAGSVRPLQTTVAPKRPEEYPTFAGDLLPVFAGTQRIGAEAAGEGVCVSGIWEPDLDVAESLVREHFDGEVVWTKPVIQYIWEPIVLEPILRVEVRTPPDHVGNVVGDLSSRRGMVVGQAETAEGLLIAADVPLSELLGYRRVLMAITQGLADATATFLRYDPAPWIGPDPDEPMAAALRA